MSLVYFVGTGQSSARYRIHSIDDLEIALELSAQLAISMSVPQLDSHFHPLAPLS